MTGFVSDIAFTPAVKSIQAQRGSRDGYAAMEQRGGWQSAITPELAQFIAARDSFFLATANASGQPYIQHRGGKPGFLKVLDSRMLAFADFRGNRQYITTGNLSENDQAFIFLLDYAARRRIKIWGRAQVVADPALANSLADPDYGGMPEQAVIFHVAAWDTNCPQHIVQRFSQEDLERALETLQRHIQALEAQIATLNSASMEKAS